MTLLHTHTDEDLVLAYQKEGSQEALAILHQRYEDMIFGTCMKYMKDQSVASDLSQELYLVLSRRLGKHEVLDFRPWLYVVVKNHCFDYLRKKKRSFEKQSEADVVYSTTVYHPIGEGDNENERFQLLSNCIEELTEDQRLCVVGFYFDKKSYQDLATELGLSWSMIRSRIQNGRRNLKNCVDR